MEESKSLLSWIILLDHSLWAHKLLSDSSKRSVIVKITLFMIVAQVILRSFPFSCPGKLVRLLMRWRWVCILVFFPYLFHFLHIGTFERCCPTLPPRLASLSLSATTDHSDVFGWRGNAITQDCLFYQSTISMFREKVQINGDPQSRLFISYISSMHINRVLWPSIPACPILLEAFSNGSLIHHSEESEQADPDIDYSLPQRRRKLYGRDLDHLPWPRSVFLFTEWRYRVDRERQWYIGCVLASTEIWDWIYGISGFVVIVSFMRQSYHLILFQRLIGQFFFD